MDEGTPLLKAIVMSPVYQLGLGEVAWPTITPNLTSVRPSRFGQTLSEVQASRPSSTIYVLALRNRHDAIPTPAGCNQILLPSILRHEAIR